jgi:nitrite reductase/ring-hydroxylating ferredoxin subunit
VNPARPPAGFRLCALGDIADPGAKGFSFREGDYLFLGFVVRRGEVVRGYVDRCPHAGTPLALIADRFLTREGDLVLCSTHGALFRPEDGACVSGPCEGRGLWAWPVEVVDGAVVVGRGAGAQL